MCKTYSLETFVLIQSLQSIGYKQPSVLSKPTFLTWISTFLKIYILKDIILFDSQNFGLLPIRLPISIIYIYKYTHYTFIEHIINRVKTVKGHFFSDAVSP